MDNGTTDSNGSIQCTNDTFKKDPAPGKNKQCVCASTEGIKIHKTKYCAADGGTCKCEGKVVYGTFDGFLNKESIQSYTTKAAWGGDIACTTKEFGRDPAPGQTKYCFCTTSVFKTPEVPLRTDKTKIVDKNGEPVSLSCANWSGA